MSKPPLLKLPEPPALPYATQPEYVFFIEVPPEPPVVVLEALPPPPEPPFVPAVPALVLLLYEPPPPPPREVYVMPFMVIELS